MPSLVVGLCAILSAQLTQAAQCQPYSERAAKAQTENLRIGRISIRPGNLFNLNDPAQKKRMHNVANSLHVSSRESTIADILTFSSGDPFSEAMLEESERVLRKKRYLRDATVVAHQLCGNLVNIEVYTIDNWTLTPSVSFGSAGGETRYAYEIQDLNVLGLGKELKIQQRHTGDLKSSGFSYGDDNVLGSRYQFRLDLAKTDDGSQTDIQGGLPYYSLLSPNSWWLSLSSQHDSYEDGDTDTSPVPLANENATFKISTLLPNTTARYARVGVGARVARQRSDLAEGEITTRPTYDFDESYPFVSAQWGNSQWSKKQNYQSLRATEDISHGFKVDMELGFLMNALGNDRDAFRLNLDMTNSWYDNSSSLHKIGYQQTQYFDSSSDAKFALSARYQYFRWIGEDNQLDLRLTGETHQGYSPYHDFSVGGAEGLKAYKTDYQKGENRVIAMSEYRHLTQWSPWSLANTAIAGFVETGRAWSDSDDSKQLANVGLGFLFSPTRSSRAAISRFDISVPLVKGDDVADYQIFIGTSLHY